MLRHILRVSIGLALAILAAVGAGALFGLPLVPPQTIFEPPIWPLARAAQPFLPFLVPLSLTGIVAGEARRWRHWLYWTLLGSAISAAGFFAWRNAGGAPELFLGKSPLKFGGMGAVAGFVYWLIAGRTAGRLKDDALRLFTQDPLDERTETARCRWCALAAIAVGLFPLSVLGWHAFYRSSPSLAQRIVAKAENDGAQILAAAGLHDMKLKIEGHTGHLTGTVADKPARETEYANARHSLSPMIGTPGIFAILQNDLVARDDTDPEIAAENARIKAAMDAAREAAEVEARRRAEMTSKQKAEAKRKAAEEARLAAEAEAKRKAAEEARRKAEAARLAAEAEAKRKAEEEAKRKAAEEAQRKAEEEARIAAEAEAKRKAEEEAKRKAAEEAQRKAEEEARIAAEVEAKRRAEEEAKKRAAEEDRLAVEAKRKTDDEAKRKAEDEARKTDAEKARLSAEADARLKAEQEADAKAREESSKKLREALAACNDLLKALPDLQFTTASTDLRERHTLDLDRLANASKTCGEHTLVIMGHADASGTLEDNQRLSEERAETVRAALVERGVDSKHLETLAFGSRQPADGVYRNYSVSRDRRVDFTFSAPMPAQK